MTKYAKAPPPYAELVYPNVPSATDQNRVMHVHDLDTQVHRLYPQTKEDGGRWRTLGKPVDLPMDLVDCEPHIQHLIEWLT